MKRTQLRRSSASPKTLRSHVGGKGVAGGGTRRGCMNCPKELGPIPTGTVAVTVLVAVLITETVLSLEFVT